MSTHVIAIGGAWLFATATALAPGVSGWFMMVAFITALILTVYL